MHVVAFNIHLLVDLELILFLLLLKLLFNHRVDLGLHRDVWVTHKALLLRIFPHLVVPDFDMIQGYAQRKVVGIILGHLTILPCLEVRRLQ